MSLSNWLKIWVNYGLLHLETQRALSIKHGCLPICLVWYCWRKALQVFKWFKFGTISYHKTFSGVAKVDKNVELKKCCTYKKEKTTF